MGKKKKKKNQVKVTALGITMIVLIVIVILIIIFSKKEKENLKASLQEKEKELEVLSQDMEVAKELWIDCINAKHWMKLVLRISIVGLISVLNYMYILYNYNHPTLNDIMGCILMCNGVLVLIGTAGFFIIFGNKLESDKLYSKVELAVLSVCFSRKQETIESFLHMKSVNKAELEAEIEQTKAAIAALEVYDKPNNGLIPVSGIEGVTFNKAEEQIRGISEN